MDIKADRSKKFQNRLLTCMSANGSIQDLLDIAHDIFQRPMFIKGDGNMIYAITSSYSNDVHPSWSSFIQNVNTRAVEFESVRTVSEDPEFSRAFSQKECAVLRSPFYGGMVLHANVWLDEKRVCEIIALENGVPFSEDEKELMDMFASFLGLHVSINKEHFLAGTDPITTFTSLLNQRPVAPLELIHVNNQTGWNAEDEFAVAAADTPAKKDTPLLAVFRDKIKSALPMSVTFIYKSKVVSIVNLTRSGGYQTVSRIISRQIASESLHCGISFEFTGIENIKEYYNLALLACSIADRLDKKFLDMYSAAHIRITERIHSIADLQDLIHPDLIRLDHLDPQRTSHYLKTLYAYLLCGGNYTDTANYLGLHRNSLIYRMNRIQGIIKSDLNDVHNRHFLLISYLLMGISF